MIEGLDSPYIHAENNDNFSKLALENSDSGPVLLNFGQKRLGHVFGCIRY